MLKAVLLMELLYIQSVKSSENDFLVTFDDGRSGRFSVKEKDADYWKELIEKALKRKHPVGIALTDSGRVTEVARADADNVASLVPAEPGGLKVFFKRHDGIYLLPQDHAHYGRIRKLLETSQSDGSDVWFLATGARLHLLDVQSFKKP